MRKTYQLDGEICANCAAKIQDKIARIDGVNSVSVNALTMKFKLDARDDCFDEALSESLRIFDKVEPDCKVMA